MNKELIVKAIQCKTKQELLKLAKENNFELSEQEAELYLQEFKEGEVTDTELDNVAGGQDGCAEPSRRYEVEFWDKEEDVKFIFEEGQILQAFPAFCNHHTATVKVVNRKAALHGVGTKYLDLYWLEKEPGCRTPFIPGWFNRSFVQLP